MDEKTTTLSILKEPCDACPFRGRFEGLRRAAGRRLKDIMDETTKGAGAYFSCHKTIYEDENRDGEGDAVFGSASVCAGWLEAVEKIDKVPQVIQVAERMGLISYREPS